MKQWINLEKIILVELLENASLQLYEVVAHHDCEESLVAGVDCHVQGSRLQQ